MAKKTIRSLEFENMEQHGRITLLERQLADAQRMVEHWKQMTTQAEMTAERNCGTAQGQLVVLQSDRDRLTAALEVCTRRLASLTAEVDERRAGWRHANRIAGDREQMPATPRS